MGESLDREDLADLVREGIYGDDRMTGREVESALGALRELVALLDVADQREAELRALLGRCGTMLMEMERRCALRLDHTPNSELAALLRELGEGAGG